MYLFSLVKGSLKILVYGVFLVFVNLFVSNVLDILPPLQLHGCIAHYFSIFGFESGIRILLSILVYSFVFKFTLSYFKGWV